MEREPAQELSMSAASAALSYEPTVAHVTKEIATSVRLALHRVVKSGFAAHSLAVGRVGALHSRFRSYRANLTNGGLNSTA